MPEEKRKRIGNMQGALIIGVAGVIDGVQFLLNFIPFIGWIFVSLLSIFAWMTFWFWFKLNNISFLKGKTALLRLAALSIGGIIEIIPIVNDLPAWIIAVAIMFVVVKLEDSAYNLSAKTGLNLGKLSGGGNKANIDKIRRKAAPSY